MIQEPQLPRQAPADAKSWFDDYLQNAVVDIPLGTFLLDLVLSAVFGYLLARLYVRCGRSFSNRKEFAHNFPLLVVTTMLVISIVKSSVALSLGLVGALSIVRFRSAVKEPEELIYLFLAIALGLGFGGNQRWVTIWAFLVIASIVLLVSRSADQATPTLHLTISGPRTVDLDAILERLRPHCTALHLIRLDETDDSLEIAVQISFESIDHLQAARHALKGLDTPLNISFLDSQGVA